MNERNGQQVFERGYLLEEWRGDKGRDEHFVSLDGSGEGTDGKIKDNLEKRSGMKCMVCSYIW